jgi:hypothetical protein
MRHFQRDLPNVKTRGLYLSGARSSAGFGGFSRCLRSSLSSTRDYDKYAEDRTKYESGHGAAYGETMLTPEWVTI